MHVISESPDGPGEQPAPQDNYQSIRWMAAAKHGGHVCKVLVAIVLARFLDADDFGLMALAMLVVGLFMIARELGIAVLIVQRRIVEHRQLSTLYWSNLVPSIMLTGIVVGCSAICAEVSDRDDLGVIMQYLSCNILFGSLGVIPSAILQRKLDFRSSALCEITGVAVNAALSLVLAVNGYGIFSLVAGLVGGTLATSLAACAYCPFVPSFEFDWRWLRQSLPFSARMIGFRILNFCNRNIDNAFIGTMLGTAALGYYGKAYQFMLIPRDAFSSVVIAVLFPVLARHQSSGSKIADYYLRTASVIALISFPAMAGLAVLAVPFVDVVLGSNWRPSATLIQILAPAGALQAVAVLRSQLLLATGRSKLLFRQALKNTMALTAVIGLGIQWGTIGVCLAYSMYSVLAGFLFQAEAFRGTQLTVPGLLCSLRRSALATLMMSVLVWLFVRYCLVDATAIVQLSAGTAVGVGVYLIAIWKLAPPGLNDAMRLLSSVKRTGPDLAYSASGAADGPARRITGIGKSS